MTYVMMVAFLILYQIFNGSIALLYLAETCTDVTFAITSLLQWITLTVVSLVTPAMLRGMDCGVFFIYAAICAGGCYFCYRFIKESSNLTDKEKKSLYAMSEDEDNDPYAKRSRSSSRTSVRLP